MRWRLLQIIFTLIFSAYYTVWIKVYRELNLLNSILLFFIYVIYLISSFETRFQLARYSKYTSSNHEKIRVLTTQCIHIHAENTFKIVSSRKSLQSPSGGYIINAPRLLYRACTQLCIDSLCCPRWNFPVRGKSLDFFRDSPRDFCVRRKKKKKKDECNSSRDLLGRCKLQNKGTLIYSTRSVHNSSGCTNFEIFALNVSETVLRW